MARAPEQRAAGGDGAEAAGPPGAAGLHPAHVDGAEGFTRFIARGADALVSLTRQVAEVIALPSTVISHGIDLTRFQPPVDRDEAWRRLRAGWAVRRGRHRPHPEGEGAGRLPRGRPSAAARAPGVAGGAGGVGEGRGPGLGERAAGGTRGRVALAGEQSVIEPWYQGLSVLVHPSYAEGYSLVHVEAMASGCCVVASKLPYLDTLIEHGRTGFFFEPGDVKALRELLAMLMREPERREAGGAQRGRGGPAPVWRGARGAGAGRPVPRAGGAVSGCASSTCSRVPSSVARRRTWPCWPRPSARPGTR